MPSDTIVFLLVVVGVVLMVPIIGTLAHIVVAAPLVFISVVVIYLWVGWWQQFDK